MGICDVDLSSAQGKEVGVTSEMLVAAPEQVSDDDHSLRARL